ncbi:MAG: hypothetical protein H0T71_10635, partial [Acidobacteria bacterium]|nr:hypothetical protein [Acidobacteriota bacterium]
KAVEAAGAGAAVPAPGDAMRDDLISALTNLGYHRQSIDQVLERLSGRTDAVRFEDVLRSALKELSRG